jgi:hypothetical protein
MDLFLKNNSWTVIVLRIRLMIKYRDLLSRAAASAKNNNVYVEAQSLAQLQVNISFMVHRSHNIISKKLVNIR